MLLICLTYLMTTTTNDEFNFLPLSFLGYMSINMTPSQCIQVVRGSWCSGESKSICASFTLYAIYNRILFVYRLCEVHRPGLPKKSEMCKMVTREKSQTRQTPLHTTRQKKHEKGKI